MRFHLVALGLLALTGAACIRDDGAHRERGAGALFETAPEIAGPPKDRCHGHGKSQVKDNCEQAKYLAQLYARRLAPGDAICLEGGFGEEPTGACLARAAIADAQTNKLLVEIRDAKPESRWFRKIQSQIWFEESALVDLYLAERGY
jgi:hypothetical protein